MVAFVGTGLSQMARSLPHRSEESLLCEAICKAVTDAGLQLSDIDGLISTFSRDAAGTAATLGLRPQGLCMNNENGCGSTGFAADVARWALESGRCNYVALVCGASESAYGRTAQGSAFQEHVFRASAMRGGHFQDQDYMWGGTWLNQFASMATRHMFEFGTTPEQLAAVAVSNRHNAALNPDAVYRVPLTVDDVLGARMISSPFTVLMCSMVNDGAAAVILTTDERARDLDVRPVSVLGSGSAFTGYTPSRSAKSPTGEFGMVRTVGRIAARDAFQAADRQPSDIDLLNCSDPFVIYEILALEDYGFCAKGEGGAFVGDGTRTQVGGAFPVNTHGGWTSGTHAGAAHATLVETIRQLQGDCGDRQVAGARTAMFGSICGKAQTHSVLILEGTQ